MKLQDALKVIPKDTYLDIRPENIACRVREVDKSLYARKIRRMLPVAPMHLDGPGVYLQITLERSSKGETE